MFGLSNMEWSALGMLVLTVGLAVLFGVAIWQRDDAINKLMRVEREHASERRIGLTLERELERARVEIKRLKAALAGALEDAHPLRLEKGKAQKEKMDNA